MRCNAEVTLTEAVLKLCSQIHAQSTYDILRLFQQMRAIS